MRQKGSVQRSNIFHCHPREKEKMGYRLCQKRSLIISEKARLRFKKLNEPCLSRTSENKITPRQITVAHQKPETEKVLKVAGSGGKERGDLQGTRPTSDCSTDEESHTLTEDTFKMLKENNVTSNSTPIEKSLQKWR